MDKIKTPALALGTIFATLLMVLTPGSRLNVAPVNFPLPAMAEIKSTDTASNP